MLRLSREPLAPYDVGVALGKAFADSFHDFIATGALWQRLKAAADPEAMSSMAALTRVHFSGIWKELEGLAQGLEVPFDDVFLWNCRGDFLNYPGDGCTTVVETNASCTRIGHNEDGDSIFAGKCKLVHVSPQYEPEFWSYCCPGSIAGHTFSLNSSGLIQTINNIRPARTLDGLPRMVLSRAVMTEQTLDGALALLRRHKTFGGFHHLLASSREPRVISVETAYGTTSCEMVDGSYAHGNHIIHSDLAGKPQIITASSSDRQRRAEELMAGITRQSAEKIRRILCDIEPGRLPILRISPINDDDTITLAQALFEISSNDSIRVEVFDHNRQLMASGRNTSLEPVSYLEKKPAD